METANLFITCTDNVRSRLALWKFLKGLSGKGPVDHQTPLYWMDFGNSQTKGQVLVGTLRIRLSSLLHRNTYPFPG